MAYKALYRTYRPKSFDDVAGQEHIVKTLQNAVNKNKFAHAYLFCGPRGTGKTSVAKIFAKAMNCENVEKKPCLACDNCLESGKGTHPDIIEIDAASNNGVEEVRDLIEKVKYAPLKGKYKIYIIDEVHMMSNGAFNALLKTIEEPPEHVIFIFATTEVNKVLPTIISRCQRYDFYKVSNVDIIERLQFVLGEENITYDEEALTLIASLADGGLRDALSILDQCIAYAGDRLGVKQIEEIYGIATTKDKMVVLEAIIYRDAPKLLKEMEIFNEKGIDVKRLTEDFIDIIKESITFEYTNNDGLLHILDKKNAAFLIEKIKISIRFEMIDCLINTYGKYREAASARTYLEICLLQMMSMQDDDHVTDEILDKNSNKRGQVNKKSTFAVLNEESVRVEQSGDQGLKENVSRETFLDVNKKSRKPSIKELQSLEQKEGVMFDEDFAEVDDHVSRETLLNVETKHDGGVVDALDEEYLIRLLVGATKVEKQKDVAGFGQLNAYRMDFTYGKYVTLLGAVEIVASGPNYMVVSVAGQVEFNEMQIILNDEPFVELVGKLINKTKKIFVITRIQQADVFAKFKDRMIRGTLPEAAIVDIEEKLGVGVKRENEQETNLLDLFGQGNIDIKED